jgi:hypothetical protein
VRISGTQVPPGYLRWAGAGVGVVVLGVLIAVVVSVFGLFGFAAADTTGSTATATVAKGVPCDKPGTMETVTFTVGGKDRTAWFDGCGHGDGEPVQITVPADTTAKDLVVHSSAAAVGGTDSADQLGLLLIVLSAMAGAGYAFLVRRGPRTARLPTALRLT